MNIYCVPTTKDARVSLSHHLTWRHPLSAEEGRSVNRKYSNTKDKGYTQPTRRREKATGALEKAGEETMIQKKSHGCEDYSQIGAVCDGEKAWRNGLNR